MESLIDQVNAAYQNQLAQQSERSTASPDAEDDINVLSSIPTGFAISDHQSANWLVQKVVAARHYAERVKQWAESELHRTEREEQTLMFLYGRQIEAWSHDEVRKLDGKRKSINLPSGTIGFRMLSRRLVIDDEARVLAWARANLPQAIVVTERLAKAEINQYAAKTGVIPDSGVHMEPASERFFIK